MNSSPDQPSQLEPVPVQLTRMEGSINLIVERIGNVQGQIKEVKTQVESLGVRVTAVELAQAQQTGASSSWRMWLPTILTGLGVLAALGLGIHFGG